MTYWGRNYDALDPSLTALVAALGFGDVVETATPRVSARTEAARAVIAVSNNIAFDVATSGARSGLQDANGIRINEPEGALGIRFALVSMVESRRSGEQHGDYIKFYWAVGQARNIDPADVEGVLRGEIAAIERDLAKHSTTIDKIAQRLEGGERVSAVEIKQLVRESKNAN